MFQNIEVLTDTVFSFPLAVSGSEILWTIVI